MLYVPIRPGAASTPTGGNVTFYDGRDNAPRHYVIAIGTSPLGLTSGDTSFTIFTLSTASHFITAVFNATTNFRRPSASNTITHLVNRADTSTTVTSRMRDERHAGVRANRDVLDRGRWQTFRSGQPGIPTGFGFG